MEKASKIRSIVNILYAFAFIIAGQKLFSYKYGALISTIAIAIWIAAIVLYTYIVVRAHKRQRKRYELTWLVLLQIGLVGFGFFTPNEFIKGSYLVFGFFLTLFTLQSVGKTGEYVQLARILVAAFLLSFTCAAFAHYFSLVPFSVYMSAYFISILLLARSGFEVAVIPVQEKWQTAIVVALCVTEVFWALGYTPFHFSVVSFLLFGTFYSLYNLCVQYMFEHLTKQKVIVFITIPLSLSIIILLCTPWLMPKI